MKKIVNPKYQSIVPLLQGLIDPVALKREERYCTISEIR